MADSFAKWQNVSVKSSDHKGHILVVEDNDSCLLVTGYFLNDMGYTYDVARNGKDALEMATAGEYTLVLMDVKMPDLDGYEITRRIRAFERHNARRRTLIIGVTAYAFSDDKKFCIKAGMDDYLSKPIDYPHLEEKLKSFIDGSNLSA